jgi:hypothetical protein
MHVFRLSAIILVKIEIAKTTVSKVKYCEVRL